MADNPQAFPNTGNSTWNLAPAPGMTLLDYFAGQAMQALVMGLIAAQEPVTTTDHPQVAKMAFRLAAAMLNERQSHEG